MKKLKGVYLTSRHFVCFSYASLNMLIMSLFFMEVGSPAVDENTR